MNLACLGILWTKAAESPCSPRKRGKHGCLADSRAEWWRVVFEQAVQSRCAVFFVVFPIMQLRAEGGENPCRAWKII